MDVVPEDIDQGAVPDDAEGFADWVRPALSSMARLASRLGPTGDRDDVVQDALVRAWSKRRQYDPRRGSASAWLLAITADQARKAHRRRRSTTPWRDHPGLLATVDDRIDVERAVARLSKRQRLAVDCYYFVGLSVDETAAVMRCSQGTVKSTLADARSHLRQLLEGPKNGRD